MVDAITAFTGRRVGVWEGHTREALTELVDALHSQGGMRKRLGVLLLHSLAVSASGLAKALTEHAS